MTRYRYALLYKFQRYRPDTMSKVAITHVPCSVLRRFSVVMWRHLFPGWIKQVSSMINPKQTTSETVSDNKVGACSDVCDRDETN